jgi:hypothetical protein
LHAAENARIFQYVAISAITFFFHNIYFQDAKLQQKF